MATGAKLPMIITKISPLTSPALTTKPPSVEEAQATGEAMGMSWTEGVWVEVGTTSQEFWRCFYSPFTTDSAWINCEWQYNPSGLTAPFTVEATIWYRELVKVEQFLYRLDINPDNSNNLPARLVISNENGLIDDFSLGDNFTQVTRKVAKPSWGHYLKFDCTSRNQYCFILPHFEYSGLIRTDYQIYVGNETYVVQPV